MKSISALQRTVGTRIRYTFVSNKAILYVYDMAVASVTIFLLVGGILVG